MLPQAKAGFCVRPTEHMPPILLTINILTFSFALWLGLYLLARNPAKALLRYAGLGILAYALSLAAEILNENRPSITISAILLLMQQFLVLLPAAILGAPGDRRRSGAARHRDRRLRRLRRG